MNPATAAQAAEIYQAAIQHAPQDYWPVENFAEFLGAAGDLKAATAAWQRECELLPHDPNSFYQYGRLLSALQSMAGSRNSTHQGVVVAPAFERRRGLSWAGSTSPRKSWNPPCRITTVPRQLDPQNATYCAFAGKALAQLNRHAEAVQHYRQAIQMQPDLWEAHYGLGDELAAGGQLFGSGG